MEFQFPSQSLQVDTIVAGLRDLNILAGDRLLIHSSLRSFGHVEGGAATVIEALLRTVGEEGTVLAPTLTGKQADGPKHPPRFNVRTTPGWTGRISEALRQWPGAVRSMGPTHSVAGLGPDARRLLERHEDCRTPCGNDSPFVNLARMEGKVVFFGVTLDANTTFHAAEELGGAPYHLQPGPTCCVIVNEREQELTRDCLLHYWGAQRRFRDLEELFFAKGVLRRGLIGTAKTLVVESGPMLELTLDLLRKDPWCLLQKQERGMLNRLMRNLERCISY